MHEKTVRIKVVLKIKGFKGIKLKENDTSTYIRYPSFY